MLGLRTLGCGNVGAGEAKTLGLGTRSIGTRGSDKQTTHDFCTELLSSIFSALKKCFFCWRVCQQTSR